MNTWIRTVSAILVITTAILPVSLVASETASLNRPLEVTVELSVPECSTGVSGAPGISVHPTGKSAPESIPSCEVDWTSAITSCRTCLGSVLALMAGAWALRAAYLGTRLVVTMTRGAARAAMYSAGFSFAAIVSQLLPGCLGCFSAMCVRELARGVIEAIEQLFTSPLWSCADADMSAELECLIGINNDGEVEY